MTLSFANEPERLTVSFAAVTAFADPSVRFGLQFDVGTGEPSLGEDSQVVRSDLPAPKATAANITPLIQEGDAATEAKSGRSAPQGGSAKIVTLDAFRKVDDRRKT